MSQLFIFLYCPISIAKVNGHKYNCIYKYKGIVCKLFYITGLVFSKALNITKVSK